MSEQQPKKTTEPSFNPRKITPNPQPQGHAQNRDNNRYQNNRRYQSSQNPKFRYKPGEEGGQSQQQNQEQSSQQQKPNDQDGSDNQQQKTAPPPPVKFNQLHILPQRTNSYNNNYNRNYNNYNNNNNNNNYHRNHNNYNNNNNNNYNRNYNNNNNNNNYNRNYNNNNNQRRNYRNNYNNYNNRNYDNKNNQNQQSSRNNQNNNNADPQTGFIKFDNLPPLVQTTNNVITDDLKKIFCLMSDEVNMNSTPQMILQTQNIGIEFLGRPVLQEYIPTPSNLTNVQMSLVDFLIEAFAVNQPERTKFNANKIFEESTIIILQIPIPLPISFYTSDPQEFKTRLGFFKSNSSTADEAYQLTTNTLNVLAVREKIVYTISNVDSTAFSNEDLQRLTNDCGVVVLRSNVVRDESTDLLSLTLEVLKYDFEYKQNMVDQYVHAIYSRSIIYKCSKCGCYFCPADNSMCVIKNHKCQRTTFPGTTEYELYEFDHIQNKQFIYEYYECCGKVKKGSQGCGDEIIEQSIHDITNPDYPPVIISSISSETKEVFMFD